MNTPKNINKILNTVNDCKIKDMYIFKSENDKFSDLGNFLIIEVETQEGYIKKFSIGSINNQSNNQPNNLNFNVYNNDITNEIELEKSIDDELIDASINNNYDKVKLLLKKGANVYYKNSKALIEAENRGFFSIINLLIYYGADLNIIDKYVLHQSSQIK